MTEDNFKYPHYASKKRRQLVYEDEQAHRLEFAQ